MKKFTTLLVTLILIFASTLSTPVEAAIATDKTLAINWEDIESVGKQLPGSVTCFCHALAYSRTILDGEIHNWWEYDLNGGNPYNACANWRGADYISTYAGNAGTVYQLAYESINAGRPFIVHVSGRGSSWHYVTIVGYTNVTDPTTLDASNFLIIDAAPHSSTSGPENMAEVGYTLNGTYQYCYTDNGSVGSAIADSIIERLSSINNAEITLKAEQKPIIESFMNEPEDPATLTEWIESVIQ